jgi:transposase
MFYGLDVHKEFIQVCTMDADGNVNRSYQVGADRESVTAFSKTLTPSDQVVLEATFHTWSIVGILEQSNVARVAVANPRQVKAIASARIKTDKIDARTLAHLLRTNLIPEVARPTDQNQRLRRLLSHRFLLTRQITALKNAVRSVINAKLLKLSPKHLFSAPGLEWLWQQNWCDA